MIRREIFLSLYFVFDLILCELDNLNGSMKWSCQSSPKQRSQYTFKIAHLDDSF